MLTATRIRPVGVSVGSRCSSRTCAPGLTRWTWYSATVPQPSAPAGSQEAFRLIRQHTTTPIAVGENLSSIRDVQHLITEQLIDHIRTTVVHAGGITHLRPTADLRPRRALRGADGVARGVGPVQAAALHLDTAVPNFGIREHMRYPAQLSDVFRTAVRYADGYMHVGEVPGLGVEYDDEAADRYPYEPRYLPVGRRLDGSVHDW